MSFGNAIRKRDWESGMTGYVDQLRSLVARYPNPDILELGGGRWPSFRLEEMPSNLASYTVNDISEHELSLVPNGYRTACFDVCGVTHEFEGRYDIVFSRFLAEHVPDGFRMHKNVHNVLKPGGIAFHLIPTLFASPFVINRILPENISQKALNLFSKRRDISPKFPAYYSKCRGNSESMRRMFREIGYEKVEILNFYGHFYYEQMPIIRNMQNIFAKYAEKINSSVFCSYAYIFAIK